MVELKELMRYEEVLLRIKNRHENGELKLPFDILVLLILEVRIIGDITNIYFEEIKRIGSALTNEEKEKMLLTIFEYDTTNYVKITTCKEIQEFYNFGVKQ